VTQKTGDSISAASAAVDKSSIVGLVKNDPRVQTIFAYAPAHFHNVAYGVELNKAYTADNGLAYATCSITFKDYAESAKRLAIPIMKGDSGLQLGGVVVFDGSAKSLDDLAKAFQ